MNASLRRSVATLVGSVALLVAPAAFAVGEQCFNDTDCPNPACGGDVCNWGMPHPMAMMDDPKPYTCVAAGSTGKPKGSEGWCSNMMTHEHCKCKDLGAKCVSVYCTFTKPSDAPAGGGMSTGGSGTATAGAATGGAGTAGTTSSAGAPPTPQAPPGDSGGCSVQIPGHDNTPIAVGIGLLGLTLVLARRRQ